MNQKTTYYLLFLFTIIPVKELIAQELSLQLTSLNKTELSILSKIEYQKKHKDSTSLNIEIKKTYNFIKKSGYFTSTIDSVKKNLGNCIVYFSLNKKTDQALINVNSEFDYLFKEFKRKDKSVCIPIEELQLTLSNIIKDLDKKGRAFSKVKLKNISIKGKILFADLEIQQSKKRTIDKVIIKGYDEFPKSYLKNYFDLKQNIIFYRKKIKEISEATKNIQFIEEIKPPEVLFTNDSTLLYVYIKKKQSNSFDGFVNLGNNGNGGILLNGNIDLKLNNILNQGEYFQLLWNSTSKVRQEFKISSQTPYIFNTKFSPHFNFSIYKQDSTFINTSIETKFFYNINQRTKLALTYNNTSSEFLESTQNNNTETYDNSFLGFQFQYTVPNKNLLFKNKFNLEINPTFGKRITKTASSKQIKINALISYLWEIDVKNRIFLKNETGYLDSNNYFENELFRIGGAKSIRGFNEQSILTNKYSYLNFEYRYLTSTTSYLYSITDFAILDSKNLLGLGVGYSFLNKNSLINIAFAVGKENNSPIESRKSKLIINWTNYF